MTVIQRALDIPVPISKVWSWLMDVRSWDALSDEFIGSKGRYRHRALPGPDGGSALTGGSEVQMLDRKDREFLRWKVTDWEPPRRLSYSAGMAGWLHGFNFQLSYGLEAEAEGVTKVRADLLLVYTNPILEVLSLVLPVRYFYGRSLQRTLVRMRSSLS
ncbi:MAG TPA: hypothetical protein DCM05_05985 [Elusimicrobia bacterium]|nr:hypothetical protein [Elusimicrobiota bacterium]